MKNAKLDKETCLTFCSGSQDCGITNQKKGKGRERKDVQSVTINFNAIIKVLQYVSVRTFIIILNHEHASILQLERVEVTGHFRDLS